MLPRQAQTESFRVSSIMADDDVLILRGKGETLPQQPLDRHDVTVESLLASPTQAGDGAALLAFLGHGEEEEGRLYLLKMHRGMVAWKLVSADLTEVPSYNDAIHVFCVKVPQSLAPVPAGPSTSGFPNILQSKLDLYDKVINFMLDNIEYTNGKRSSDTYSSANSEKSQRNKTFKESLLVMFTGNNTPAEMIECCITKLRLPSHEVVAGHIFPHQDHAKLRHLCPSLRSVDDPQNGILWASCIEDAFEEACIACKWNQETHTLKFFVLDRNLLKKNMYQASKYVSALKKEGRSFSNFNGDEEASSSKDKTEIDRTEIERELENVLLKKREELTMQGIYRKAMRGQLIDVCKPFVRELYSSTSYDSFHLKEIQFQNHVNMDKGAWCYCAVLSFQIAMKRDVLPDSFPQSELFPEELFPDGIDLNEPPILAILRTQPTGKQVGSLIDYVYRNPSYKVLSWLNSF